MTKLILQKEKGKIVAKAINSGERDYARAIRASVYGLWTGEFDLIRFVDAMVGAIRHDLVRAWREGAQECGIAPEELTLEELRQMRRFVNSQYAYIDSFGQDIEENSKANKGKLGPHYKRAALWVNRYGEARQFAKQLACKDRKLHWQWHPAKEHCDDCKRLNGRVYRASVWKNYGIRPRMQGLACGGWACGCEFVPTDEKVTSGRPPAIV